VRVRRVRPAGWWFDALLVIGFLLLTGALWRGWLLDLDTGVRNWSDGHRPTVLYWAARAGNLFGQGTPLTLICLGIAVLRGWKRPWLGLDSRAGDPRPADGDALPRGLRRWWPVLLVLAAFVLTFFTVGPLKVLTDRAGPHADRDIPPVAEPERFGSGGLEYPSGHLANAIVWYGVLVLLLSPWLPLLWRRLLRIGPPAVLAVTTVYLSFHWFTDTVAGIALGLFLDRLLHRVPWDQLRLPRRSGRPDQPDRRNQLDQPARPDQKNRPELSR
jgi:membrane-associated phospholipid phosphatase